MTNESHGKKGLKQTPAVVLGSKEEESEGRVSYSDQEEDHNQQSSSDTIDKSVVKLELYRQNRGERE